jgi:hypothetical protein
MRGAGQQVTADDFFGVLSDHTSVDVSDLVGAYFGP